MEDVKIQLQREKKIIFAFEVCNQRREGVKINYRLAIPSVHKTQQEWNPKISWTCCSAPKRASH